MQSSNPSPRRSTLALVFAASLTAPAFTSAQELTPPNYDDDIAPIMAGYCIDCHRGSKAKNGMKLGTLNGIFDGGSSGPAIVPGDGAGSLLYQLVAHEREPYMPHEDDPLPAELVARIKSWIDAGAPENAASPTLEPAPAAAPMPALPAASAEGAGVMPTGLSTEPLWWSESAAPVTAIAASPRAPLIAIAGHRQATLYHADSLECVGVLGFPEGAIETLEFSSSGELLLAGGGEGATSGRVVAWDVATGGRVLEIGEEPDTVLAAHISPDHRLAALAGPDRIVRVYATDTREQLFQIDDHTDWVTALTFSPDGVLLATADRTGAVNVWEALTGRLFHALPPHKDRVTALAWRHDSLVLASAAEDAAIRLCEMENGTQVRTWNAPGGVLDMRWGADGRLVTAGRDRHSRIWDQAGAQHGALGPLGDIATAVGVTHDAKTLIVGDLAGSVTVFAPDGTVRGRLPPNPPTALETAARQTAARAVELQASDEQHAAALAAARARAQEEQAERTATEGLAGEATVRAEAARLAAQEAASLAEDARLAAVPFESGVQPRRDAVSTLASAVHAARAEASATHARMLETEAAAIGAEEALLLASHADRETAQQRLDLLRQLAAGAAAIAEQAAGRAAELESEHARLIAAVERWHEITMPRVEAARLAAEASQSAAAQAAAAREEADALTARLAEITARNQAAMQALQSAEQAAAASAAALAEARDRAAKAAEAWAAQREQITSLSGRVGPDTPAGDG